MLNLLKKVKTIQTMIHIIYLPNQVILLVIEFAIERILKNMIQPTFLIIKPKKVILILHYYVLTI